MHGWCTERNWGKRNGGSEYPRFKKHFCKPEKLLSHQRLVRVVTETLSHVITIDRGFDGCVEASDDAAWCRSLSTVPNTISSPHAQLRLPDGYRRRALGSTRGWLTERRLLMSGAAAAARGDAARSHLSSPMFLLGLTRHAHYFSSPKG